jgi:hypothetical protein
LTPSAGCELYGPRERGRHRSLTASEGFRAGTPAQVPRIIFHVPPLLATAERPRERTDTVWSPNDDRDSIQVVLIGGSNRSHVDIKVEVLIEPQSQGEDPPRAGKGLRAVNWKTIKDVRIDSLSYVGDGHLLLLVVPSTVKADRTIAMDVSEEVGGIRVSAISPAGQTISASLSFLPAI